MISSVMSCIGFLLNILLISDVCWPFVYVKAMEHSYENSIVLTTVPKSSWDSNTNQIYIIPGTPYDLARNQSYYYYHYHLTKGDQRTAKLHGCKTDYSQHVMYMYDERVARIEAIPNFDWRDNFARITKIVRMHIGVSVGAKLAIDWVSHNIYWTDPMFRWIAMQSGDTTNTDSSLYKVIAEEDIEWPCGIAVDPIGGYLFWSDISKHTIERSSLTGNNRMTIVSSDITSPACLEVDYRETTGSKRRVYWADSSLGKLESANLNGGERRVIKQMSNTKFFDMALFRDVLSVVDVYGDQVYFVNKLNGQEFTRPYSRQRFLEEIWGICMYDSESQPLKTDHCGTAGCSDLCVNDGGKATCLCREGYSLSGDGYSCIETAKYHRALVLADSHSFYLADTRCLTANYTNYPHTKIYNTHETIQFLTVDMVERNVIFATETEIYSLGIDADPKVPQHIVASQQLITGLSFNWLDKTIYWTSGSQISFINQGGIRASTLLSGLDKPRGLQVLAIEKKMLWISGTTQNSTIEIADLTGTHRKALVPSTWDPLSLSYDSQTRRLYWAASGTYSRPSGTINRINIDGTGIENLHVKTVTSPKLCLIYKDYLAWTEDNYDSSIMRSANAREPSQRLYSDSFAGVSKIVALQVLDGMLQRQPGATNCSRTILHGKITGPCSYLPHSNCTYTCDNNYEPAANSSKLMCVDGQWHENTPCVPTGGKVTECPRTILHGQITDACSYLPQSNCTYTCDNNYKPATNNSMLMCVDGHWHDNYPCVVNIVSASSHFRWCSTWCHIIWLILIAVHIDLDYN